MKHHMIPYMQTHENHGYHDSMHGIAWSCDDMVPCMELHKNLMNSDPGVHE